MLQGYRAPTAVCRRGLFPLPFLGEGTCLRLPSVKACGAPSRSLHHRGEDPESFGGDGGSPRRRVCGSALVCARVLHSSRKPWRLCRAKGSVASTSSRALGFLPLEASPDVGLARCVRSVPMLWAARRSEGVPVWRLFAVPWAEVGLFSGYKREAHYAPSCTPRSKVCERVKPFLP